MASEEVKLIDFDTDVVKEGKTVYVHDFFNNSWKKTTAVEVDLEEREILVQYDDRSQEWIRMDGTKMCFSPPPISSKKTTAASATPTSPVKKTNKSKTNTKTNSVTKKSAQVKSKTITKKIFNNDESKNNLKEVTNTADTTENEKDSMYDFHEEDEDSKSTVSSPFPRIRPGSKSIGKTDLMIRHKKNDGDDDNSADAEHSSSTRRSSRSSLSKEGEKEVTKFKIRIGKASDILLRKKGKLRSDDSFSDANEEMSVVVNDDKLPSGWSKHMVKRKSSNKWDIVIQNEEERKFRSRAELRAYFETINETFPEELFDFSSGKRSPAIKSSTPIPEKNSNADVTDSLPFLSNKRKIKTLLPRRTPEIQSSVSPHGTEASIESNMQLAVSVPSFPLLADGSYAVSPLPFPTASSNSCGFICPKQDCKKNCRTENLLMMHIRHSHQEYKSMLKSMPNVADLAYARTVGQSIDTAQTEFLEKIAKIEENKMKEKPDGENDVPVIDEDFTLKIETDDEAKSPQTDKSYQSTPKPAKKGTPTKKVTSPVSSPSSSSVLLAQLQQPPLVPPSISIQSEHTDAEISVSQNSPIAYSPKVSNKDASTKSSPLSESDSGRKSTSPRKRRVSQLEDYDVINCTCGYGFEDGLMMQCDLCCCWQHGSCNSIENEEDTPSPYICHLCQNPRRIHSSKKYVYVQNWLKFGKIPKYEFSKTADDVFKQREQFVQKTHEFLCNLAELKNAVHSLQVKFHILRQTPDHPKLYLWAKSWNDRKSEEKENLVTADSGPVPEVAINMADCRKHLSEHIDEEIEKAELMLQNIEDKIDKLEDDDDFGNDPEKFKIVVKQTLLMMLRDLSSIQNLKYC